MGNGNNKNKTESGKKKTHTAMLRSSEKRKKRKLPYGAGESAYLANLVMSSIPGTYNTCGQCDLSALLFVTGNSAV